MIDFKQLITRMADELDHYRQLLMDDRREVHALATEARAALAQPEPEGPTDEEILQAARDAGLCFPSCWWLDLVDKKDWRIQEHKQMGKLRRFAELVQAL